MFTSKAKFTRQKDFKFRAKATPFTMFGGNFNFAGWMSMARLNWRWEKIRKEKLKTRKEEIGYLWERSLSKFWRVSGSKMMITIVQMTLKQSFNVLEQTSVEWKLIFR